jgi:hypothetical protein
MRAAVFCPFRRCAVKAVTSVNYRGGSLGCCCWSLSRVWARKQEIWTEVAVIAVVALRFPRIGAPKDVARWKRESMCASRTKVEKPGSTCNRRVDQSTIKLGFALRPNRSCLIVGADCISTCSEKEGRDREIAEAADKGSRVCQPGLSFVPAACQCSSR